MMTTHEAIASTVPARLVKRPKTATTQHLSQNPQIALWVSDILSLCLAILPLALVPAARQWFPETAGTQAPSLTEICSSLGLLALWLVLMGFMRSRDLQATPLFASWVGRFFTAGLIATGIVLAGQAALNLVSPTVPIVASLALGVALLMISRGGWSMAVTHARKMGSLKQSIVVVGTASDTSRFMRHIAETPSAHYAISGYSLVDPLTAGAAELESISVPYLGGAEDLLRTPEALGVSEVVLTNPLAGGHEDIQVLRWKLEQHGIRLSVLPMLDELAVPRLQIIPVNGLPVLHANPRLSGPLAKIGKRSFDIASSALGLILLSPILLVLALGVRLDSTGPVLFRQIRVGKNGQTFSIIKFRTMSTDAEDRLKELVAQNQGSGPLFKMKDDPRVTKLGYLLRKSSLDELPQLWNVLRGDMSLVGPRPPLPSEVQTYDSATQRRLMVNPGITGLWQVSGRSDLSWDRGVRYDLHYVENWSFQGDLAILVRTVGIILNPKGAY